MSYEFKIGDYVKLTKEGQDEVVKLLRLWVVPRNVNEELLKHFSKKIFKIICKEKVCTINCYKLIPIEDVYNGKMKDLMLRYNRKFSEVISISEYYIKKYYVDFLKQWGKYARTNI